jgi:Leucine-rich repeat (LRR) protein
MDGHRLQELLYLGELKTDAAASQQKCLDGADPADLCFHSNTLVRLPSLSGVSKNLEQLQLYDNPLTEIPDLGSAPKLTLLDMNSCQLASIDPARLTAFTAVTNFNLKGNSLVEVPDGISVMKCLEILNVGANKLTDLPQGLAQCPALKVVLANNNEIVDVPGVLLKIPTIQRVMLKGCPVEGQESDQMTSLEATCKANQGWVR